MCSAGEFSATVSALRCVAPAAVSPHVSRPIVRNRKGRFYATVIGSKWELALSGSVGHCPDGFCGWSGISREQRKRRTVGLSFETKHFG
jgi:hypothetical protein